MEVLLKENLTSELVSQYEDILYGNGIYISNRDKKYYCNADYVMMTLLVNNEKYIIIHGFPGDEPGGVIINSKGESVVLGLENRFGNPVEIYNWYYFCMKDCTCNEGKGTTCMRNHADHHYWFWKE